MKQPDLTRPIEFKADGPFAIVRHPIYLGWVLMVFATPVMTTSQLLFAVISTLYLIAAIPLEERSLVEAFGGTIRRLPEADALAADSGLVTLVDVDDQPRQPLVGRVKRAGSFARSIGAAGGCSASS